MALAHDNTYQLKKLFDEYYTPVLLYSISIVRDRDDAADIVQRAFIAVWLKMEAADFDSSARAYLYKSVYHASLDLLKHKKVRTRYEEEVKSNMPVIQAVNGEEKELQERIVAAINELPEQCRRIFTMSRHDGLRYKDIAAILHISEKTVENQMGKALKILRGSLMDYLPMLLLLLNFFYGKR